MKGYLFQIAKQLMIIQQWNERQFHYHSFYHITLNIGPECFLYIIIYARKRRN